MAHKSFNCIWINLDLNFSNTKYWIFKHLGHNNVKLLQGGNTGGYMRIGIIVGTFIMDNLGQKEKNYKNWTCISIRLVHSL
ncbi:hypothetical protein NARC_30209 [Candidatus Nitrosocosmicus arcticus]|uniref:Uncharacterized protein n=1 Tax=Candidatus Nitrosocosmicus arcticus TaxID=2035267 RepID=A0A557SY06_9ARCH|nr:hypothetical protein NARC_30209 [Candidatus Nitrosocosmicus arcticus]